MAATGDDELPRTEWVYVLTAAVFAAISDAALTFDIVSEAMARVKYRENGDDRFDLPRAVRVAEEVLADAAEAERVPARSRRQLGVTLATPLTPQVLHGYATIARQRPIPSEAANAVESLRLSAPKGLRLRRIELSALVKRPAGSRESDGPSQ